MTRVEFVCCRVSLTVPMWHAKKSFTSQFVSGDLSGCFAQKANRNSRKMFFSSAGSAPKLAAGSRPTKSNQSQVQVLPLPNQTRGRPLFVGVALATRVFFTMVITAEEQSSLLAPQN